jgi:hypothetical protein
MSNAFEYSIWETKRIQIRGKSLAKLILKTVFDLLFQV